MLAGFRRRFSRDRISAPFQVTSESSGSAGVSRRRCPMCAACGAGPRVSTQDVENASTEESAQAPSTSRGCTYTHSPGWSFKDSNVNSPMPMRTSRTVACPACLVSRFTW